MPSTTEASESLTNIVSFLRRRESAFLADLAALVNVDCGTDNKPGVDWVGQWLAARLEAMGAEITCYPQERYGDCWLGRWRGNGTRRILLVSHLDTVYPPGTAEQRPMRVEGTRAIGPGVSDMKGGLLAGLYAVAALQHVGFSDFAEIGLWAVSDEEQGSPVSHELTTELARQTDAVLVLEAARANGDIVSGRKGSGQYEINVQGRAAHAGVEPEKGANAILELAHRIVDLHSLNGLVPGITVSAGLIRGGTAVNVVPDQASAVVDVRVVDADQVAYLDRAIRALIDESPWVAGTQATVRGGITMPPMPCGPGTRALVDIAKSVARRLGFDIHDTFTGGSSDGNFAAAAGIPVLDGLGPIGGLDHSPAEYLEIDSIVPRTALLAGLMMEVPIHETSQN